MSWLIWFSFLYCNKENKEIGVRKVLGSSIQNICFLLSKDLLRPVLLGTLLATPVGYYAMNNGYKVLRTGSIFIGGCLQSQILAAFMIALLTVGFQAVKAAFVNR
jgi:putative ABC transport system permease protein